MPLRWLLPLALALGSAGCARETRVEMGARSQCLIIGNAAEPKDLDPAANVSEAEYVIDSALFEGLVSIANDGKTILPGVAERWDISPDGRIYTFHLRADARWSDGSPVTAGDFLYAFRRVFLPSMASENNSYGFAIAGSRAFAKGSNGPLGLAAPDPRTFQVRLESRTPYILYILAGAPFQPVPPAVVERFGGGARPGTAWTRPGNIVGNGPFVLRSWHPDQEVVVTPNPNYWDRGRIRLREVHFLPMSDAAAEERAFRAGELHVTWSLPEERIAAYRDRPGSVLHVAPQLHTSYILFNTARRPFDDVRVRRAFSLCIDRDRLIPTITHGAADPAHSLTRPGTAGYRPPPCADFDPAEARRLLAAAGHAGGAGLPPVALSIAGKGTHLAEALQEAWSRELGVRVEIQTQEEKVLFDSLDSGNFQFAQMGFFYAVNAPETILMIPLGDSRWNTTRWKSPAYDAAFRAAGNADNDKDRFAAFDTMERILRDEAPFSPLLFPNQANLISPLVHGWRDNPLWAIDWRELSLGD